MTRRTAMTIPALRSRFLAYGSRATSPPDGNKQNPSIQRSARASPPSTQKRSIQALYQFLDYLTTFTVPHNYFTHFYVLSVLCSVFWGYHLWSISRLSIMNTFNYFFDVGMSTTDIPSMTVGQTRLAWLLMLLQGVRRLLESCFFTSKSKSQMWIGHYILGLLFYLATNIAIWVEGVSNFEGFVPTCWNDEERLTFEGMQAFQWKLAFLPPAILTAHVLQHIYHSYLYRLRTENATYRLPSHPLFPNLLCPHYTCEVAIYLFMALLTAPAGRLVNWTLASATVFVAVNLGVTANGTREWYIQRFGAEKVEGRSRMVPWMW
ncbi:hypothetical protein K469DRAFT_690247 [Zopfia rhizophila CBS 207.26]|uniref:Polyprenal reductase n=1 Tax=Zopfia rhizophila CBS 207.26 TaxID=1314779 RepID=A0A6A6DZQ2_9PEZI|nr:hypothetical protein K469DRAFT_690247 [Zopfia rhizophila CBS 207.26]